MSQYTKEDVNRIQRYCHDAGMLIKKDKDGYKLQRVGTGDFIKLGLFENVVTYIMGYRDGFYEDRLFVKRRMNFDE